jgi:serine/threonine protein kinase/Tfp pilus assembly protein PilF
MPCSYCGASTSPGIDRCGACQALIESANELSPESPTTPAGIPHRQTIQVLGGMHAMPAGYKFGTRYTIIRMLGAGGMGTVYQAWDETIGGAVALKLLRVGADTAHPEFAQLEDRFKRELKLARQVSHPNVVRIHDIGEAENSLYLTMEYVQGTNLATLWQRESPMAMPRVLALARQIAAGLAAAHRVGIVHRDLKPANIMVDPRGRALLMDFGIARSTASATAHTAAGAVIGTLDYMAPEQARGDPADERADVYAFGVILYELLSARRSSSSTDGGLSSLLTRLDKGLPALRTVCPDVPAALERIVNQCVATAPERRYPSAQEVLAALEALDDTGLERTVVRPARLWPRVAAIVAISASLIAGGSWFASRGDSTPPSSDRAPLPVLIVDFENRAGDADFDGVLEQALSLAVEGAPFIAAFPRRDAAAVMQKFNLGSKLDESVGRLIANREEIPIVLAGMIERSGAGYKLAVRASATGEQQPLTTAQASAPEKAQVLAAIGRVGKDLREALGDTTIGEAPGESFTTASVDAMRAYILAQDLTFAQRDADARVQYQEALRLDPEFGRAYSGLSAVLVRLGRRQEAQKSMEEALRRADRMTEREKLRTYGAYYLGFARNYDKAIETYEELARKYPADSAAYNNLAVTYFSLLNFAKALEYGRKAIAIYPKAYKHRSNYALYAMYAGDFSTAANIARELIKEDASVDVSYLPLAMEALATGDIARTRRTYEQAAGAGDIGISLKEIGLADVAMYEGRYAEAIALLSDAAKRDQDRGNTDGAVVKLVALAEAHAARNEAAPREAAIAAARKVSEQDNVLVPAARMAIASGKFADARSIIEVLSRRLPAQSRAYAKMIDAEIAMSRGDYPSGIDALNAALKLADLWLVRFSLGLAYFHRADYPEATSEFEKCLERRGESTAIFLDDLPSFRYYATLPYWLGRAREMQKLDARPQFQEFLRIRQAADADPLVEDARKRLEAAGK